MKKRFFAALAASVMLCGVLTAPAAAFRMELAQFHVAAVKIERLAIKERVRYFSARALIDRGDGRTRDVHLTRAFLWRKMKLVDKPTRFIFVEPKFDAFSGIAYRPKSQNAGILAKAPAFSWSNHNTSPVKALMRSVCAIS